MSKLYDLFEAKIILKFQVEFSDIQLIPIQDIEKEVSSKMNFCIRNFHTENLSFFIYSFSSISEISLVFFGNQQYLVWQSFVSFTREESSSKIVETSSKNSDLTPN